MTEEEYSIKSYIDLAQILVRTESIKGKSIDAAIILFEYFKQHNLNPVLDEYSPGEANVYVKIGPVNKPVFLLSGHLDTVPPGDTGRWTHFPYSGEIIDGTLWGRGSVDMKGGLAILADIIVEMSKMNLKQQVLFVATSQEETGLLGAKAAVKHKLIKEDFITHILIAEPTGMKPLIMEKGVMWLEIKCIGRQAHGSRPDLGVNAVSELMRIVNQIPPLLPTTKYEDIGGSTMNITTIKGGESLNVGAETAVITLDIRIAPGENNTEVQDEIRHLLDRSSFADLKFEMKVLYDEPSIISPTKSLAEKLAHNAWKLTGQEPEIGGAHYTTDGTVFQSNLSQPVPYVIFGPGSPELLHQTDEHIKITDMMTCKTVLFTTISEIVGYH